MSAPPVILGPHGRGHNSSVEEIVFLLAHRRQGNRTAVPAGHQRTDNLLFVVISIVLTCSVTSSANAPAYMSQAVERRLAARVYSFLRLESETNARLGNAAIDERFNQYLAAIQQFNDRQKFDLETMAFVAQFANGHTYFQDSWLEHTLGQPIGFYAAPIGTAWIVQLSTISSLSPGDKIFLLDNVPIEQFYRARSRFIGASSERARKQNFFLLPVLFPPKFSLTLANGRIVEIERGLTPSYNLDPRWQVDGQVVQLSISSFSSQGTERRCLEIVRRWHLAKVIIVDVRDNPGGSPPFRLIRALMDRPYRGWEEATWKNDAAIVSEPEREFGKAGKSQHAERTCRRLGSNLVFHAPDFLNPEINGFSGRLILLVNGGCASACEDFVEPFKDNHRAMIVGETTQGSAAMPVYHDLQNGMGLMIATKRFYFPDGSEFEGVGIKPDIEIHPTIEDLKAGRDVILDKALKLAASR